MVDGPTGSAAGVGGQYGGRDKGVGVRQAGHEAWRNDRNAEGKYVWLVLG